MRKLTLFFIFSLLFQFITIDAKGQEKPIRGLELAGGVGVSWFAKNTRSNYMEAFDSQFDSNVESFQTELKPGTFLSAELRYFKQSERFKLLGYLSYSQYSIVAQFNVERNSLGWTQHKEKRTGSNYLAGIGFNVHYLVFNQNNHHLSPYFGFGMERNVFYRIHYDQEIKFNLEQEPTTNKLTEYGRYRSLDRDYYGRIDVGIHYMYYTGRFSPFAELVGRRLTKFIVESYDSSDDYWAMYINFGVRFNFK